MIGCPSPFRTATAGTVNSLRRTCRHPYNAQIFTNDREKLGAAFGHDVSHSSAHAPEMKQEQAVTPQREQGEDFGIGL